MRPHEDIGGMKIALLLLAACAALLPDAALAARPQSAQAVLKFDLYACSRPVWPAAALAQRASGTTTLEVRISERGHLLEGRVVGSAGRADLDDAALDAMRGCSYQAVLSTGQAPTGWLKTQYKWTAGGMTTEASAHADITQRAEDGDPDAQNTLGTWYERGTHVDKDLVQAAIWYERAARGGNAHAQNNLGVLYFNGAGVPLDRQQAAYWYAQAAEQGHGWAQFNLAWSYRNGVGNDTDPEQALYWLTRAADGGLGSAQVYLGTTAMRKAVTDDERLVAAAWLARAAALDDPSGVYLLGRSFELGMGNAQDDARAAALYRRALGRSAGRADTALGILLDAGRALPLLDDEAARLYEQGMQARHAPAFYRYGLLLEARGDEALAAAVFRLGAGLGSCDAVFKYVQLRPSALAVDPMASHPPQWVQRQQGCRNNPAMQPRFE